jgi:hypothetical protein
MHLSHVDRVLVVSSFKFSLVTSGLLYTRSGAEDSREGLNMAVVEKKAIRF